MLTCLGRGHIAMIPLAFDLYLGVNIGKGVNLLGKPVYKMAWEEERAN